MIRYYGSQHFPKGSPAPVVALGNFDGVHMGHQRLISAAREAASRLGGMSLVYTFDPHPVRVLAPKSCPPQLQTLEERLESLASCGAGAVIVEPFTHDFAQMTPLEFFEEIIVARIGAKALVAGYDFTFGLHRRGTAKMLAEFGNKHSVEVISVEPQFSDETLVSSTNIRRLVYSGDVETAARLLGRPYMIRGAVVSGRGIGGTLHAHTANIETKNEIVPQNGVYVTRTRVRDARRPSPGDARVYDSITSIGDNPTFPEAGFSIETHLIDVDVNILHFTADVEFLKRMRDQVEFPSREALAEQIQRDIGEARQHHSLHRSY